MTTESVACRAVPSPLHVFASLLHVIASALHVIASAAKQSILSYRGKIDCFAALAMTTRKMDCFAEPVIGRARARPVGGR